jgi:NACalpha-BTF3-like transcription factor
MTPFDFINAINTSKENLFRDPQANKDYNAWIVNKGLSYFPDTVLYANEMNFHRSIPKEWQFQFLLNSIPKKKRFSKWSKKDTRTETLSLVMEYFGYSEEKAKQALSILNSDQLTMIKEKLYKGGK